MKILSKKHENNKLLQKDFNVLRTQANLFFPNSQSIVGSLIIKSFLDPESF